MGRHHEKSIDRITTIKREKHRGTIVDRVIIDASRDPDTSAPNDDSIRSLIDQLRSAGVEGPGMQLKKTAHRYGLRK